MEDKKENLSQVEEQIKLAFNAIDGLEKRLEHLRKTTVTIRQPEPEEIVNEKIEEVPLCNLAEDIRNLGRQAIRIEDKLCNIIKELKV